MFAICYIFQRLTDFRSVWYSNYIFTHFDNHRIACCGKLHAVEQPPNSGLIFEHITAFVIFGFLARYMYLNHLKLKINIFRCCIIWQFFLTVQAENHHSESGWHRWLHAGIDTKSQAKTRNTVILPQRQKGLHGGKIQRRKELSISLAQFPDDWKEL